MLLSNINIDWHSPSEHLTFHCSTGSGPGSSKNIKYFYNSRLLYSTWKDTEFHSAYASLLL